jgi:hypothetical protein
MFKRSGVLLSRITVLLLVIFPFISYWNVNKHESAFDLLVYIKESLIIYASVILFLFLFVAVLSKGLSYFLPKLPAISEKIALASGISFIFLFTFSLVHDPLIYVFGRFESSWPIGFSLLLFSVFTLSLLLAKYEKFRDLTTLVSIFIVLLPSLQIGYYLVFSQTSYVEAKLDQKAVIEPKSEINLKGLDRPNVYYVVVDAYGGADALRRFVDLDIGEFLDAVRERDMFLADSAKSPYNLTFLTLAAILTANYPIDEFSQVYTNRRGFYPGLMVRDSSPPTVAHFDKLGYAFNVFGNRWGRCQSRHVVCPPTHSPGYLSYEIHGLLSATPFAWYQSRYGLGFIDPMPSKEIDAIGNLMDYLQRIGRPESPAVFFVHHLSPHPPYMFKSDCSIRESYSFDFDGWSEEEKPLYAANTRCTNNKILSLLDWIDINDPKSMVVITGDHGTAFSKSDSTAERASTLTLARFPSWCQQGLSQSVNSVNLMRIAMACAAGKEPELLENKTYFGTYKMTGERAGRVRLVHPKP